MSQYSELDAARIVETSDALRLRVEERFPESGLAKLAAELFTITQEAATVSAALGKPNRALRAALVALIVLLVTGVVAAIASIKRDVHVGGLFDLAQGIEAAVNDAVFVGIAIYFLASLEARFKRTKALRALHRLRQMAHIIDMHQLTKDPERVVQGTDTAHSPKRTMTPFELTRYLDYCSEMLAILGKVASLYVQHFADPVTASAASEVENLTVSLSRNIWQKIMILDRIISHPSR
jgi:hypothetical protein